MPWTILDQLQSKVNASAFINSDPFPERQGNPLFPVQRDQWRAKDRELTRQFRQELQKAFVKTGCSEKRAEAWVSYVWDQGHSSGFEEVLNIAIEIITILEIK